MWLKVLTPKDQNGRSYCNLEGNRAPPWKQLSITVCHYVNVQLWIVFVHQHHLLLALDKTPPSPASLSFLMVQSQRAIKSFCQHFLLLHIETEHKQLSKVGIHEDHRSKDWEVGRWTVLSVWQQLTTVNNQGKTSVSSWYWEQLDWFGQHCWLFFKYVKSSYGHFSVGWVFF